MATQAALIADTIVGMKRALRRERDDSGPDDLIAQPTNRGNKMKANAKYVREGAMGYINAEEFYKEKVEHAGYTRYILQRNPIRYDSEGDELGEDDEDSEADAAVAEENPFSGIALETLLRPLTHPSELPVHPSLSQSYTSPALDQMTVAVEEKLRQERALLWRARNLHRSFLGDGGWMPCGLLETLDDRYIFEPKILSNGKIASSIHQGFSGSKTPLASYKAPQEAEAHLHGLGNETRGTDNDTEMAEVPAASVDNVPNYDGQEHIMELKSEEADATVIDLPPHPTGTNEDNENATANHTGGKHEEMNTSKDGEKAGLDAHSEHLEGQVEDEMEQDAEMHNGSPTPPRRMTTRARANANQDAGSPTSTADTASTLPTPHPLFLVPEGVRPDANFGLPAAEAEDTRRLLWSYIQKQEETVRGFEHMLDSLLRACHMKANVLEWCKAEGHVGEMSDGEDWYDREKWGLGEGEDLKKGTDEDEVETIDERQTTAKRGRGRRQ
ncbi:uncharacterized protein N7477_001128 [Penicillium maclennaniae]|uniref:uncharacterized protein n=1 Tax=Penicillium maclennaniae TaxID=1343394 RepID=UPI0025417058|nr:uncharacterized protein N7477_001128 [Penicillium maclennaniae]KAJ5684783.1 hypothetical protein N7477_001128 [Penicillium maclennaniae]